jgi:colanic acid/amylovoran biosynthesis glycosyltransferase
VPLTVDDTMPAFPKIAYVLLWFPKPSETFVFREVVGLWEMGVPVEVFSLYGRLTHKLSPEMRAVSTRVERLGIPFLLRAHQDLIYWLKRDCTLLKNVLAGSLGCGRSGGLEKTGENLWATLCGLRLARRFEEEGIRHIHAPWASGPATAAWVASRLTHIPFSFSARAWDIHPPDGVLAHKIRAATFVRSETAYNVSHLAAFNQGDVSKIHVIYNGLPLLSDVEAPVRMISPYKLLAVGRFVGKKGFDYLLAALKILKHRGLDFTLTFAGDGPRGIQLKHLAKRLGVDDRVVFAGFVSYDHVSDLFCSSDILLVPSVVHSSGDRDGIPTVIMEALKHRVPVIATAVAGIPEVIEDRVTGLLIPEKDGSAIAEAIMTMVHNRDMALRMAENGRKKVLEQFDPLKRRQEMLRLFQSNADRRCM